MYLLNMIYLVGKVRVIGSVLPGGGGGGASARGLGRGSGPPRAQRASDFWLLYAGFQRVSVEDENLAPLGPSQNELHTGCRLACDPQIDAGGTLFLSPGRQDGPAIEPE